MPKSDETVIADNFASDGARAKLQRPACSFATSRTRYDVLWCSWICGFECEGMIFRGQKYEK